jgi:hypothetical protein
MVRTIFETEYLFNFLMKVPIRSYILAWHSNKLSVLDYPIKYGYITEATISYYPIPNGWKLWYGKNGLFYYESIQDCRSYDLQNFGL